MRLVVNIGAFELAEHWRDAFAVTIEQMCATISLNADDLEVCVADEDHYLDAVRRVDPEGSTTVREDVVGVGKTISRREGDRLVHYVVLRDVVLGAFMAGAVTGRALAEWPVDAQQLFYALPHELGHCLDNTLRPGQHFQSSPGTEAFSASAAANYYLPILESEFAACLHSARWVSPDALSALATDTAEQIRAADARLAGLRGRKVRGIDAHFVAGGLWFQLIQAAKLFACSPAEASDRALEVLVPSVRSAFSATLSGVVKTYPAFGDDSRDDLSSCWVQLLVDSGVVLEEEHR